MNYIARRCKSSERTQSIRAHLKDSAEIAAERLKCAGLECVGRFTVLAHDVGKFSDEFGNYLLRGDSSQRGSVNHSAAGALYIYHHYYEPAYKKGDGVRVLTAQIAVNAIYCHHMRMYDCISPRAENVFINRMESKEECGYEELMGEFFRTVMDRDEYDSLFERSCKEIEKIYKSAKRFDSFTRGMIQRLVHSALIDADRYDAYCFEADEKPAEESIPDWEMMNKSLKDKLASFEVKRPIDIMRKYISDECGAASGRGGGVYRLSVPTGAGKTLSSLRFALGAARDKRHVFYIVPYTTILDQTYEEFSKICGDNNVMEHHSGIVVEDDDIRHQIYTERWTAPVILTTFVQFMNSLYAGKTACVRRMAALCDSVLIFDEVQSMQREVVNLFNEAVNFLVSVCRCTVLLCTATQPVLETLKNHPLQLAENCDIVTRNDEEYKSVFKRNNAVNMRSNDGMSCEEIADFACGLLGSNRSVLVVMNTVSEARRVYDNMDGDFRKIYLSTDKCRATRMKDIEEIRTHTRKLCEGDSDERLAVISTQLVEAGVDISFECAIRAQAGLDNLVQTAGRCGRNGEFGHICDVYSVNVRNESLKYLPDIERAKRCFDRVLDRKDGDMFADEMVREYYKEYYRTDDKQLDPMDYICDKTTIMEMLSDNKKYVRDMTDRRALPVLRQAFETAGRNFSVIKAETESVIVPCDREAKEYISMIRGGTVKERADALKRCGKYTVNIFGYKLDKLRRMNAVYFEEEAGVWILEDGFYNDEYGVITDGESKFLYC